MPTSCLKEIFRYINTMFNHKDKNSIYQKFNTEKKNEQKLKLKKMNAKIYRYLYTVKL